MSIYPMLMKLVAIGGHDEKAHFGGHFLYGIGIAMIYRRLADQDVAEILWILRSAWRVSRGRNHFHSGGALPSQFFVPLILSEMS